MTSSRPYFLRGIFEWIVDNHLTPHVLIDARADGVIVPQEYVEDGKIVLNISPDAVHSMVINNQFLEFKARFSGVSRNISVPVAAILAIYARENGKGMVFNPDNELGDPDGGGGGHDGQGGGVKHETSDRPKRQKPSLTLVKK